MRTIFVAIIRVFYFLPDIYTKFGLLGIVSLFYPVHWSQDTNFVNNGYDILRLGRRDLKWGWFYGTYWAWLRYSIK